jgi:hypothetical protein
MVALATVLTSMLAEPQPDLSPSISKKSAASGTNVTEPSGAIGTSLFDSREPAGALMIAVVIFSFQKVALRQQCRTVN